MCLFLQNGACGSSKVNIGSSKVNIGSSKVNIGSSKVTTPPSSSSRVTFDLPGFVEKKSVLTFDLPMLTFDLPTPPFCRNKRLGFW